MANLLRKLGVPSFGKLSVEHKAGMLGVGWTTLGQIAGLVVRFGSVLILQRLLVPADYGIFNTAFAVGMILELISDFGMRPAIVRHPLGEQPTFVATAWLIIILRGLILAALTVTLGLILPQFYPNYDSELLFKVLAVLALRPIIHSFANPMAMMLHRHMRFDRWSLLAFGQTVAGTAVTLTIAAIYGNVWAIVLGTLFGEAAFVALTYILCKRPPLPRWNSEAAGELSHFGNQVFINTLVMALWLYVDRLVGPRYMTPELMGIYAMAWNLMEAVEIFGTKACEVYYSTLTKIEDLQKQAEFHSRMCRRLALFGMPALGLAVLVAPWVVVILSPKFVAVGPVFAILIARVMVRLLGQVQFQMLLVRAEIHVATKCYLIAFLVQAALIVPFTLHWGVTGIAYSVLISTSVHTLAQNIVLKRRYGIGLESFFITLGYTAMALLAVTFLYP